MKFTKVITKVIPFKSLFTVLALISIFGSGPALFAQNGLPSAPAWSISSGPLAPTTGSVGKPCADYSNVGSLYTQTQNPSSGFSGLWVCEQTGSMPGGFGWVAVPNQSSTPGSGTFTVASGKAGLLNNSLTFAGTDSTTVTFPTTSATIARTDSAQTFTGIQTFSSAPVIATITNTGTETLPTTTGGLPVVIACGATSGGTANCANTNTGATARAYYGKATLASNASVITFAPGFTDTTYICIGQDQTTRANVVNIASTSATTATITNVVGASDVIFYACFGN